MAFGAIRKPQAPKAASQRQQGSPTNTRQRSDRRQKAHAAPSRVRYPVLLAAQSDALPRGVDPAARRPETAAVQQKRSVSQHARRGWENHCGRCNTRAGPSGRGESAGTTGRHLGCPMRKDIF
ncbi:hypothetical protein NDU88_005942 [Pleurodeles waltl]|uniref:Uncharacterized protein n=1 Tax=Pleurodeles waltl TaxID=8319 RepID=A0AAV7TCR5_PLEWA|nr:hypothetical protein NDU88_005942 [Pleurodeles waltl]